MVIRTLAALLVLTGAAVRAQDDIGSELDATRAEMRDVDAQLDSVARSLQERLNLQGDDISTVTEEVIRLTTQLEQLYSRPDEEVAADRERINELQERLSLYEGRLRELQQQNAPETDMDEAVPETAPDTASGAGTAGDDMPVYDDEPVYDEVPPADDVAAEPYYDEPVPDDGAATGSWDEIPAWDDEPYDGADDTPDAGGAPGQPVAEQRDTVERITRFRILGNDNLPDGLIARTVAVAEGTPFDSLRVRYSDIKLAHLRALYHHRFTVRPDSTRDSMDVTLRVSDMAGLWTNPFDFTMRKVREVADARFSLTLHNIRGTGRRFTCATAWDWQHLPGRKEVELRYTVPYQFGLPFLWQWYLFDRKVKRYTGVFEYDDMTTLTYGGGLRWYHRPTLWFASEAGLQYVQRTFNRRFRPADRDGNLLSAWVRLAGSTRDRLPRERIHLAASVQAGYHLYHGMGVPDTIGQYGRFEGRAAMWTLVLPKLTAGTELRYGVASRDIPVDLLFAAGDETVLRGHHRDWRLGTCRAHNTTELSYAVHPRAAVALFTDIGMVWPLFSDIDPAEAVWDVGTGVTVDIPYIGPGRFDLAINPADETWNLYFGYSRFFPGSDILDPVFGQH